MKTLHHRISDHAGHQAASGNTKSADNSQIDGSDVESETGFSFVFSNGSTIRMSFFRDSGKSGSLALAFIVFIYHMLSH